MPARCPERSPRRRQRRRAGSSPPEAREGRRERALEAPDLRAQLPLERQELLLGRTVQDLIH